MHVRRRQTHDAEGLTVGDIAVFVATRVTCIHVMVSTLESRQCKLAPSERHFQRFARLADELVFCFRFLTLILIMLVQYERAGH